MFKDKTGKSKDIKKEKRVKAPSQETIAAMRELKAGKGTKFASVNDLFNSI